MNHALDVRPVPVDRRMDRRLGRYRPLARDALGVKIDGADILWIRQNAGKSWVNQKSFCSGNSRAEMARPRQHSFTCNDLKAFHQTTFQILDGSALCSAGDIGRPYVIYLRG